MKIGFDATILTKRLTGIGYYTINLIDAILDNYPDDDVYLFAHRPLKKKPRNKRAKIIISNSFHAHTFLQSKIKSLLMKYDIDIIHGPNFYLPLLNKIPSIVTIHDMSAILFPKQHTFIHRLSQKMLYPSANSANAIICVSSSTAADLIKLKPGLENKIHTIHSGIEKRFSPDIRDDRISSKYNLPDKFILFLGTLEPRKNLNGLLRAFSKIRNKIPHRLVIAGGIGWKNSTIFDELDRLGIKNYVHFPGYIDDKDLPSLYRSASIFVYPSFYEGFGLPPLEAMACGIPTITSNISSMPEIAGEAAMQVDPHSADSLADAILQIAQNPELATNLAHKGIKKAQEFTWDKTAQKTVEIYKSLLYGNN
ncbi:MAG: glycosyltransferase family 4 protein [Candidatus Zixiibacteriota bacterium]